jgi:hypothetical protein
MALPIEPLEVIAKLFDQLQLSGNIFLANLKRLSRNATGVWRINVNVALQQLEIFIGRALRLVI